MNNSSSGSFQEATQFAVRSGELAALGIRSRSSQVSSGQQKWEQLRVSPIQLMGKHQEAPHRALLFWLMAWASADRNPHIGDVRPETQRKSTENATVSGCFLQVCHNHLASATTVKWKDIGKYPRVIAALGCVFWCAITFLSKQQRFPTQHLREKRELGERAPRLVESRPSLLPLRSTPLGKHPAKWQPGCRSYQAIFTKAERFILCKGHKNS